VTFEELESFGFFGNNYEAGLSTIRFLTASGYDFRWQYFPGRRHTWANSDYDTQEKALRFIWQNWEAQPIETPAYSPTLAAVVDKAAPWQTVAPSTALPPRVSAVTAGGTYEASGGEIWLSPTTGRRRKVADGFQDISAVAVSSDLWRLYVSDRRQRYLLSLAITPDGSLKDLRKVNVLHIASGSSIIGAKMIAVDTQDRIFAATDAGIQVATPGSYVQMILPLPGDLAADNVVLDGQTLYATAGQRLFKRPVKVPGRTANSPSSAPSTAIDLKFISHPFVSGSHRDQ
jgi:hypothetical protein